MGAGYRGCAVVNATTDTRGDADPAVADLARTHLERYRDLLIEQLGGLAPPPHNPAQLARQLLLLIEGATVVTAIDGHDSSGGTDAHAAAITLLAANQPSS